MLVFRSNVLELVLRRLAPNALKAIPVMLARDDVDDGDAIDVGCCCDDDDDGWATPA